jgi:tetratricopeptide (TPR) repeat protein
MDSNKAWELVKKYTNQNELSEEDRILYEEALYYILVVALEIYDETGGKLFQGDVEAGAYNLAAYYEQIGKYDLAIKYYEIAKKYGLEIADEAINRIRNTRF